MNPSPLSFPPEADLEVIAQAKADKAKIKQQHALQNLTIVVHGVEYDANDGSQLNMSALGAISNWKFNQTVLDYLKSIQTPSEEMAGFTQMFSAAYDAQYKTNKVKWKGTDNKLHNVQVESVLEALERAVDQTSDIIQDGVT